MRCRCLEFADLGEQDLLLRSTALSIFKNWRAKGKAAQG